MADLDPYRDVRVLREPTVYLPGRRTFSDRGLDCLLADHAVTRQTGTDDTAEPGVELDRRFGPRPGPAVLHRAARQPASGRGPAARAARGAARPFGSSARAPAGPDVRGVRASPQSLAPS